MTSMDYVRKLKKLEVGRYIIGDSNDDFKIRRAIKKVLAQNKAIKRFKLKDIRGAKTKITRVRG